MIVLGLLFHVRIHLSAALGGSIALTTFVFASLAICAAMVARTHSDLGMLSSFIVTPMAFLCGTFFPIDLYLKWVAILVGVLPLTPATTMIRATAEGRSFPTWAFAYLGIASAICFSLAVMVVRQTRK